MLIPVMRYRDCEAALMFLTDVFGLSEHAVFRDDAGRVVHAQLSLGGGMVVIGPEADSDFGAYMMRPSEVGGRATVSIYAVVHDVAERFARAQAAGAEILIALRDEDHGGESFSAHDPEGHVWTFGSYDPLAPALPGAH